MSGTTTIASLPVAISVSDSDLMITETVGSPNVTKRATAAQVRAGLVSSTGPSSISGGLTLTSGGLTVTSGTSTFNDTVTLDAGGGWSSANVGKGLFVRGPGTSNPGIGIVDQVVSNPWAIWNNLGTLVISSMPSFSNSVTAPTNIISVTKTGVSVTGTLTNSKNITVTTGGLTVSAGGAAITGNSTITGTLGGLTGLTVASGGAAITGNSTITGTLGGLTGLTVASGGASISGTLTATDFGASTFASTVTFNGVPTFGTTSTFNGLATFNAGISTSTIQVNSNTGAGSFSGFTMSSVGTAAFGPVGINYGLDASLVGVLGGQFYAVSDVRRKRNRGRISPEDGLAWCLSVYPETFEKSQGDLWIPEAGFIAQQVARVSPQYIGTIERKGNPELVEDDGFTSTADHELSFNYQVCHAYATAAIQRLSQLVDALTAEVAELKGRP